MDARSASLRILYSFPGAIGSPGPGAIAWHQVNQLVRLGHDVTLVVASVARAVVGIRSIVRSLDFGGRRIPERSIGRARAYAWHDWRARRVLATGRFDVVHAWPLAAARTLELAERLGVVGLREAPGTHFAQACTAVSREYALLGLQIPPVWLKFGDGDRIELEEREYAAATALLVPSDAVANSFLARGYDPSRLIRHQYGFDPAEIRVQVREKEHPFTALFLGRCVPRKGLHYALKAWLASRASETGRLLIYGTFDEDYREVLRPFLAHPSITLYGPTEKPGAVYAKADALLLPSVEEGSALATYEAQGAGVIPLASTASGGMIEHGVNGLLHEAGDTDTLAGHIDLLYEQEKVRRFLRTSALSHAQQLTWATAGRELEHAYRVALDQPTEDAYGRPSERTTANWDDSAVS
ncbi:glycosyltransferase family 4 protein [Mycetocola sp.]|uniref:glycosyltransferase family 4 protein n=1 Tax=Mycetocola sp. TaxID=1871042 RepID=UPI00398946B5